MRQRKDFEAYMDDFHKVVVYLSKNSYGGTSNRFTLKDHDGSLYDLRIQSIESINNNYNKYILSLEDEIEIGNEYYVFHQHARSTILHYGAVVKTDKFDEMFFYDGDDLGYQFSNEECKFALWAPTAYRVKLELLKNGKLHTYEMKRDQKGVFRTTIQENLENATYVYLVRVNGEWKESIDPYANASIENTRRSAIIDMDKIKVKDYPLPEMKSMCDAIIYETSVRDFTIQPHSGVSVPGTFRGFVQENAYTRANMTGFTYLKSLGITHLQLMPVFDFGSVDENYPRMFYNWGYDPVQYRVLEGSFCLDPNNPYARIFGFIELVEACHKAGIRVNLDVVFNHVYDKENHFFDKTVPNYFFQMNQNGSFSNGTWCGNDVDSTRKMSRKYIIDTCKFIVETFHIDGFRFDLMGILDIDTMNEVARVCREINPDFMIYGEGWDMPSYLEYQKRATINNNWKMNNIAHFSDRFRDVAKGKTSQNEVNMKGYCTGAIYLIDIMKNCLMASCTTIGDSALFAQPTHCVNYVECHDNMTSWDKIKECCKEDSKEVHVKKHRILLAATLLAQGIPFIHSGQEFCRTKFKLHNTYESNDEINKIDYIRRNQYQDVVNCTKDLIQIRKAHPCLRYSTKEDVEHNVRFDTIQNKALIYICEDDEEELTIIFNPTLDSFNYQPSHLSTLIYEDKAVDACKVSTLDIQPYSVVILKYDKQIKEVTSDIKVEVVSEEVIQDVVAKVE